MDTASIAPTRPKSAIAAGPFLDDLKATVPIYALTGSTAEIVARIGGEQAANGINLPLGDLMIGACALELGYAIGTSNPRDFSRIPGLQLVSL